ncbi:MAG: ATP-binding protein [Methylococcaceae bacterium]|nr:ATP-binding protein [Methylococcaceae bacterium]
MPNNFDRELTLKDLLLGIDSHRLLTDLQGLLDAPVAILDSQGICLVGEPLASESTASLALVVELESIGKITADAPVPRLQAATDLVTLLLRINARYLMASDLHMQTQQADFDELQRRHIALEKSEQRYKALAETLEQRVKQQVKTIESAQIKLYESEKLASVGRLAAGVAHEINNPIGFIRSNLSTASSYLESLNKIDALVESGASAAELRTVWHAEDMAFLQKDLRDILDESINGTDRIAAIVRDLKGFSRINEEVDENADINQIIRQVCNVAAAEIRGKAEVLLDLGEIPLLHCHPGELGQVFLSLLMNGVDAMSSVGKIQFRTRLKEDRIHIDVRDNGCGMPESVLTHIYDPFFTTKEVGKGMGLGLTVCLNIIKAHDGGMEIKSKPNQGTLVSIILPVKAVPSC